MHDRTSRIVAGRPGDEARSADGEVPGSQRPWPRHPTGRHERPRRRAGRDGRERTGPWRMSFAERVSAGQARLGSLWTLHLALSFGSVLTACGSSSSTTPVNNSGTDYSGAANWIALPASITHKVDVFYPVSYTHLRA